MRKSLLKLICVTFVALLCLELNAQNLRAFADAYIGDGINHTYCSLDLATGAKTTVGTLAISPTSTGEDWDGENIYRMHGSSQYGLIKKVEEDGTTTTLGTLTGGSWIYTVGLAYDWVNDDGTWYFLHINNQISNPDVTLYSCNLPSLAATKVGNTNVGCGIMRGLAMADDGYLYAVSTSNTAASSNLIKIDPSTGAVSVVGPIGFPAYYAFDLAFDRVEHKFYIAATHYSTEHCLFGTINKNSGTFTQILDYGAGQRHDVLTICKRIMIDYCPVVTNVTAAQCFGTCAKITWTAPTDVTNFLEYKIYEGSAELGVVSTGTTTFITNPLAAGSHSFSVEAIYSGDCVPKKVNSNALTIITCGDAIEGVAVVYNDCKATVTWDAVAKTRSGIVFNNAIMVTHPGAGPSGADVSAVNPGQTIYGSGFTNSKGWKIADDFVLETATEIQQMEFYGIQQNGTISSFFTAVYVQIYDAAPNEGGNVIYGDQTTNRLVSSSFSGIWRASSMVLPLAPIMKIIADVNVTLLAGTYWVVVSATGAPSLNDALANPVQEVDIPYHGNGLLDLGSGWEPWKDYDGGYGSNQPLDLPFIVYGEQIDAPAPKYNVYMDGVLVVNGIEGTSYTHNAAVAEGVNVTWCVTNICTYGGESAPGCVTGKCGNTPPPCDKVADAKAEIGCKEAKITWSAVAGAIGYKISDVTVTGTEYTENGVFENGKTYTWKIITLCEENSSESVEVSALAKCDAINEFSQTISIYPNPANSTVNIKVENFAKVEVYSAIGQLMVAQNTTTVDVSNYQAGIYFFKVFDNNNNTAMKRISVIK